MVKAYLAFLGLLALERLAELGISRRHEAWAKRRGGLEFGRKHFRFMAALHGLFLVSCAGEVLYFDRPFLPYLGTGMLVLSLAAQALRYWCISALGRHWSVRVIVVPGAQPVTTGPYRFLRHPNYLAVIVEGFAVPLVHTAWLTAFGFTVLNAFILRARILCEEKALMTYSSYRERMGMLPRLVPSPRGPERR